MQFDHLGEGSIPIGISTTPPLAEVTLNIWNWYPDHLPDSARLVAGPSGSAYSYLLRRRGGSRPVPQDVTYRSRRDRSALNLGDQSTADRVAHR
ncbi:MAG: hypothetical protein GX471_07550 [Candidatus Microthrix parvicella]|uniref:Uncharacterized protein n=1 Tax=Candidatus Neomicrothrix parvicella RN1 TaxID=1229780 RepID=R4YWI7_9ACTN|nr:hypothetical protein [Candidatus Microthrix sp.]NLH66016.1 hypothetical protein [Candidatus Microthrix parvicella]CCM62343.1 hypothetical protein BN381_110009 [Candidatus Microthrix parvicella RN1]MBK7019527.1 hypothetical protein [Candidatus Microthrix sp.]MBL0204742.1 hypothetical protein [Candidatus Microthrix sp.]